MVCRKLLQARPSHPPTQRETPNFLPFTTCDTPAHAFPRFRFAATQASRAPPTVIRFARVVLERATQVRIATTICSPLFFVLIASIIAATAAEVAISVPAARRHVASRRTSTGRLSTYEKSKVPMPHRQAIEASSPCPVPMQNATRNWARILGVPIVAAASYRRCCGWKPQPRNRQVNHRIRGALIDVTPLSDGDGAMPSSRDPSSANRERTTSILTGLTRWSSMPASFDRRRSSGCP